MTTYQQVCHTWLMGHPPFFSRGNSWSTWETDPPVVTSTSASSCAGDNGFGASCRVHFEKKGWILPFPYVSDVFSPPIHKTLGTSSRPFLPVPGCEKQFVSSFFGRIFRIHLTWARSFSPLKTQLLQHIHLFSPWQQIRQATPSYTSVAIPATDLSLAPKITCSFWEGNATHLTSLKELCLGLENHV